MFKRFLLAATLFAVPAVADETIFEEVYGHWATRGVILDDGKLTCDMNMSFSDKSLVFVRSSPYINGLVVELTDPVWKLAKGAKVPVVMQAGNERFEFLAESFIYGDGDSGLGMLIGMDSIERFAIAFAVNTDLEFHFPGSKSGSWKASLKGSRQAIDVFTECVALQEEVANSSPNPDPFNSNASTDSDPFGTGI